jgi:hypothetical protein
VLNVEDSSGIQGATVYLYRSTDAGWRLMGTSVTNDRGLFGFSVSRVQAIYKMICVNAAGWTSVYATLPGGLSGTVVNADELQFPLPPGSSSGEFIFWDQPS